MTIGFVCVSTGVLNREVRDVLGPSPLFLLLHLQTGAWCKSGEQIRQRPYRLADLAGELDISEHTAQRHLALLVGAGLLEVRRCAHGFTCRILKPPPRDFAPDGEVPHLAPDRSEAPDVAPGEAPDVAPGEAPDVAPGEAPDVAPPPGSRTEKDSQRESSRGEVTVVGGPPPPVPPAPLAPPEAGVSAELLRALRGLDEDVFTTPISAEERRVIAAVFREPKLRGLSPTEQAGAVVVAANAIAAAGWHRTPPLWAERIKKAVDAARASPRSRRPRPMAAVVERAGITRAELAAQQASAERIMARRRGDAVPG